MHMLCRYVIGGYAKSAFLKLFCSRSPYIPKNQKCLDETTKIDKKMMSIVNDLLFIFIFCKIRIYTNYSININLIRKKNIIF